MLFAVIPPAAMSQHQATEGKYSVYWPIFNSDFLEPNYYIPVWLPFVHKQKRHMLGIRSGIKAPSLVGQKKLK